MCRKISNYIYTKYFSKKTLVFGVGN
jgi:hypothetical protein